MNSLLWKSFISMLTRSTRMPGRSWATELFSRVMKNLFAYGNSLDLKVFRAMLAKPVSHPALRKVDTRVQSVSGVECTFVRPKKCRDPKRVILYFHGGGYVVGSPSGHMSLIADLAVRSDCLVIAPDYQLAPEHPFPAPQEDCLTVAKAIIKTYDGHKIIFAGDSAGGGLTLMAELELQKQGGSSADALILICPWVDPSADTGSIHSNAENDYLAKPFLDKSIQALMQGASVNDSKVNFSQVDLSTLPPTLVQYGTGEVLSDQIESFSERAISQGAPVTLSAYQAQFHVFQFFSATLKDAKSAMAEMADFVKGL